MTTNNTDVIRIDIWVNGGRLGEVGPFAVVADQAGSKPKVLSRIAQSVKDYFLCLFSKRIVCKSEPEVHFYRKLRYARED